MIIEIKINVVERALKAGDVIVAEHHTGKMLYYKLVKDSPNGYFRLLNLQNSYLMSSFRGRDGEEALDYIEIACKAKVIKIVPSDELKISNVN